MVWPQTRSWRSRLICVKLCRRKPGSSFGVLRRVGKLFDCPRVLQNCFNAVVLSNLEYCAACRCRLQSFSWVCWLVFFCIAERLCESELCCLGNRRKVSAWCLLYKINQKANHPLHKHLQHFVAARITRASTALRELALVIPRCRTNQFVRPFLPVAVRLLLLLLHSPSHTLLECWSNQRIRPKTDSRVPKCGDPRTPRNRVRGWAQWTRRISEPLRAHPTDLLGCSLQHQLAPQPAADTSERYEKSSLDPPHIICKQGQPLGEDDSHMSGEPDDAHIAGEQDALVPVDAGLPHLDSQVGGPLPE